MTDVLSEEERRTQTCTQGTPCEDKGRDDTYKLRREASKETNPDDTLILDF